MMAARVFCFAGIARHTMRGDNSDNDDDNDDDDDDDNEGGRGLDWAAQRQSPSSALMRLERIFCLK